jgi:hypothetical protein
MPAQQQQVAGAQGAEGIGRQASGILQAPHRLRRHHTQQRRAGQPTRNPVAQQRGAGLGLHPVVAAELCGCDHQHVAQRQGIGQVQRSGLVQHQHAGPSARFAVDGPQVDQRQFPGPVDAVGGLGAEGHHALRRTTRDARRRVELRSLRSAGVGQQVDAQLQSRLMAPLLQERLAGSEQGAQVGGAECHRLGTATARGRQQLIPERVQPTEAGQPLNRSGRAERAGQGHQHRPHRAHRRTVRTQVRHRSLPLRSRTLHVSTGIASPAIERTGAAGVSRLRCSWTR